MLHNTLFHRSLAEILQLFLHNFEESGYSELPFTKRWVFSYIRVLGLICFLSRQLMKWDSANSLY